MYLFTYYKYPNKNFPEGREQFSLYSKGNEIIISGGIAINEEMCKYVQGNFSVTCPKTKPVLCPDFSCVKNKNDELFLEIEFGRVEYKEETNIIQLKEATRQYYNSKAQQDIKIKEQKQDDFIRIIINCMKEIMSNLNSKIEAGRINDFTGYKGILDYYDCNESLDIYAPRINNDDEKGEKDKLKPPTCEYDLEKEEISLVLYYPFSKEKDLDIAITESSIETGALLGLTIKKEKEYLIPTKKMGENFIKVTIKYNFGTQKEEEKGSSYTLLPGANK